jgi:hypothetical protein
MRINVFENTFEVTFRNIHEHSNCVLIIPYEDTSLSLYPGQINNKSSIDYRDKLEAKGELLRPGSIYTQDNFFSKEYLYHCIAFAKIDEKEETIDTVLKQIFEIISKLQRKFDHLTRLVIPLSLFTHHTTKYSQFMKRIMTLMECKKYSLVSLTTKDLKEWSTALEAFSEITLDMIKNQIVV